MIGLRCYDSDGDITLDITDSLTRLIGSRVAGDISGSFTVACNEMIEFLLIVFRTEQSL